MTVVKLSGTNLVLTGSNEPAAILPFTFNDYDMMGRLCLVWIAIMLSMAGSTQPNWQLAKNSNGIKIYTKNSDHSAYKSIKVEATFTGTWDKLLAIITDVNHQKRWVYSTKDSYLIKKINEQELQYYVETALPWPAENRDVALQMKIYPHHTQNVGKIVIVNKPELVALKENIVRLPYFNAVWEVKPVDNQHIAITYYLDMNPGGTVPGWVVNLFTAKGPYETFMKLGELLRS